MQPCYVGSIPKFHEFIFQRPRRKCLIQDHAFDDARHLPRKKNGTPQRTVQDKQVFCPVYGNMMAPTGCTERI